MRVSLGVSSASVATVGWCSTSRSMPSRTASMASSGLRRSSASAAAAWVRWNNTSPRNRSWVATYSASVAYSRTKSIKAIQWSGVEQGLVVPLQG